MAVKMCQYCIRKFTLFVYCSFLVLLTVCSQNINKQNVNIADKTLTDYNFLSMVSLFKIKELFKKYDIEFVTEFPCLLGHPVECLVLIFSALVYSVMLRKRSNYRLHKIFVLIFYLF